MNFQVLKKSIWVFEKSWKRVRTLCTCYTVCTWKIPNCKVLELGMGQEWSNGTVHLYQTSPTEESGLPRKVDRFFRNFCNLTEQIHSVSDQNVQKFWFNGSCLKFLLPSFYKNIQLHLTYWSNQVNKIIITADQFTQCPTLLKPLWKVRNKNRGHCGECRRLLLRGVMWMCNTFMYVQPEASVREIAELTLEKKNSLTQTTLWNTSKLHYSCIPYI